jgi:hypothetical protein
MSIVLSGNKECSSLLGFLFAAYTVPRPVGRIPHADFERGFNDTLFQQDGMPLASLHQNFGLLG